MTGISPLCFDELRKDVLGDALRPLLLQCA